MSVLSLIGVDQQAAALAAARNLLPASTSKPTATDTGGAGSGGTITSNDFLSLLVTEMKNQDPTQPTDPNAYIQQLVGVNSLQQLIAINKDLTNSPAAPATPGKP